MNNTCRLTAVATIAITLGLTGCGGSSSSEATEIGLWKASAIVLYSTPEADGQSADVNWTETLTLNEDGTYTGSWQMGESTGTTSGTYTIAGSTLTMTDSHSSKIGLIVTDDELTLIGSIPEGTFHLTYTKQ